MGWHDSNVDMIHHLMGELLIKNQMIISMAKKKYNFNKHHPDFDGIEDDSIKNIQNDIDDCGFSVDKEEIFSNLLEADSLDLDHPTKIQLQNMD